MVAETWYFVRLIVNYSSQEGDLGSLVLEQFFSLQQSSVLQALAAVMSR